MKKIKMFTFQDVLKQAHGSSKKLPSVIEEYTMTMKLLILVRPKISKDRARQHFINTYGALSAEHIFNKVWKTRYSL